MATKKKAQITEEVFKYAIVAAVSLVILIAGYGIVNVVKERICRTEIAKFEIDLRNIDKSLRYGARELQRYDAPCKVDRIYFLDLDKKIDPEIFNDIPLMKDALKNGGSNNVFLVKDGEVKRSFYTGSLEMAYPYHMCFLPKFDKISFFAEGAGKSAKITSECSQPECTFIPEDISEELSKQIIKEAVDFGCANCPRDADKEAENIKLTRQNVEVLRKFLFCDGITDVQIVIRPKKGSELKDFRFYEFIPKACIDDLNRYLAENLGSDADVKSDPLIMWHFSDLGDEKKISYKLSTSLNDECMQSIKGLGVARLIKNKEQDGGRAQNKPNTPPAISGLPDAAISGLGLKNNVISNLWRYSYDEETQPQNLIYTIVDQTNSDLVDCRINDNKHVDCDIKKNTEGASKVTVQADDLEFRSMASFNVRVTPFCKKYERKDCVGDEVHWFDSCGQKGEIYYNCRDNWVRNKCRNAQCCVGNFFCQAP